MDASEKVLSSLIRIMGNQEIRNSLLRNRRDAADPMGVNRRNDSLPKSDRPTDRTRGLLLGNEGERSGGGTRLLGGKRQDAKKKAAFPLENGTFGRFSLRLRRPAAFSRRLKREKQRILEQPAS